MSYLLDSHILVALAAQNPELVSKPIHRLLWLEKPTSYVSTASLWELEIKLRIGKLRLTFDLRDAPQFLKKTGIGLLSVEHPHIFADVRPEPRTRDPFDRLLLGVCAAEGLRLVTLDRVLAEHPLAWRGVPPVQ